MLYHAILERLKSSRDAPTVPPPFSLNEFARDTERTLRAAGSEPSPQSVPRVVMPAQKLQGLAIDHRAGFVLSLIDGETSVEGITDIAGMPGADVITLLARFAADGVITFD